MITQKEIFSIRLIPHGGGIRKGMIAFMSRRKKQENNETGNPIKAADLFGQMLELPPGTLSKGAHIELASNREAMIDGCKGVLEYDENLIKLNTGNGTVQFTGRSLEIKSLTQNQAVIVGFILNIEFSM